MARLDRTRGLEEADERLPSSPNITAAVPTPDIPADLINFLNSTFPDKLPKPGSPYSELERAWGRREVIDFLIRLKEQNEQDNHVLRRGIISTSSPDAGPTAAASG